MPRWSERLKDLIKDQSASAMLISAFCLLGLVGAAGLGTDVIQWTLWQRQLQRMADSAAYAAAYSLASGASANTADSVGVAELDQFATQKSYLSPTITFHAMPTAGSYANRTNAYRIALSMTRTLPFSSMIMSRPPAISAEATAAAVSFGDYCLLALEPGTSTAVTFWGSTKAALSCGVASNSTGPLAVNAGGSSSVTASPIAAVGGVPQTNNYTSGTVFNPYSLAQADPYKDIPMMAVPSGCNQDYQVKSNNTDNLKNNTGVQCYKNYDINGTTTFDDGIYIVNGGTFSVGAQGSLTCHKCVFLLTGSGSNYATVNMNGGASIDISAPDTGAYSGLLFYQDRNAPIGTTNKINGDSKSIVQGALYFPRQYVEFTGNSDMTAAGIAGTDVRCLQIVARRIELTGNSKITNSCPNAGPHSFTGTQVRLVG